MNVILTRSDAPTSVNSIVAMPQDNNRVANLNPSKNSVQFRVWGFTPDKITETVSSTPTPTPGTELQKAKRDGVGDGDDDKLLEREMDGVTDAVPELDWLREGVPD